MGDDCWGPDYTSGPAEPEEWDTEEGYNDFHARYKLHSRWEDAWTCKKCGLLVGNTTKHDKWHRQDEE